MYAAKKLRPDVVIGMGDCVTQRKTSIKRIEKMGDRTSIWVREMVDGLSSVEHEEEDVHEHTEAPIVPAFFAPVLPISLEQQFLYLRDLEEDFLPTLSGLAIHDAFLIPDLPEALKHLPHLSLDLNTVTPHSILQQINLGMDIFTIEFINASTDAGLALSFSFSSPTIDPSSSSSSSSSWEHYRKQALASDLWLSDNAILLTPLMPDCTCYSCSRHHRAYIHHLLIAKEMLGWVLLQIHNLHVMDEFFADVRRSMTVEDENDDDGFEKQKRAFEGRYETEWPTKTGQGPR